MPTTPDWSDGAHLKFKRIKSARNPDPGNRDPHQQKWSRYFARRADSSGTMMQVRGGAGVFITPLVRGWLLVAGQYVGAAPLAHGEDDQWTGWRKVAGWCCQLSHEFGEAHAFTEDPPSALGRP
jgi:hypothetical protein